MIDGRRARWRRRSDAALGGRHLQRHGLPNVERLRAELIDDRLTANGDESVVRLI